MAVAGEKRVVVVGLGSIGRRHARLLAERPDVRLEVIEPEASALAAAEGELGALTAHESFDAMIETRPDVVWVATPTSLHARQTIAALDAGCHVFCEKPMSDSIADARAMKESAENSGKILNVGFMLHFVPAFLRLKELIGDGALGQVLHAHAHVGTYVTLVNSHSRYQSREPGSLFLDYAHQPDLFYWLLGRTPEAIRATAFRAGGLELSSDPNVAVVVCEYTEPLVTTIHLNYVQMPQRHTYEVVGDRAWATLDFETGELRIGRRGEQSVTVEEYPYARDDIYRAQIGAFFAAAAGKRRPETSASDGLVSTALCAQTIEAWRSGRRVEFSLR